jgi:hypothetical protein
MKVVWLVSGDSSVLPKLQKELERSGAPYLVRHSHKISLLPPEHLGSTSTAVLVDSFHVEHTGFDGLKELRELGFKGAIYMFGEPAPEKTTIPFTQLELSGFFPAVERADLSYIASIIHHGFELNDQLKLSSFLGNEHKAGSAKITNQEDVEKITQKLTGFASRFGVKEETIKKTIMGLCMGHIQTKHGESQISEPFELNFGTDRSKIVLSVNAHSKGNDSNVLRSEFAQALANFHNSSLKNSVLFQEFHHLVKAVNNLTIIGGSSKVPTECPDPMFLITRIQFESLAKTDTHLGYYFSIHHTKPSEDMDLVTANLPLLVDSFKQDADKLKKTKESTVTSHSEKDLNEILNDPMIVIGDAPESQGEKTSLTSSSDDTPEQRKEKESRLSHDEKIVNKYHYEKLKNELELLKENTEILSQDIFRLMKERKEPALDTELQKQNEELKNKIVSMESEFEAAVKKLNNEIEELKTSRNSDTKKVA